MESRLRHGYARNKNRAPEYRAWQSMRKRCSNEKDKGFKNYGGRGIRVCERWNIFENFLADMGHKPSSAYSLERKNNDGNYDPSNCCWATRAEQNSNKRHGRAIGNISTDDLLLEIRKRVPEYGLSAC